MYQQPPRYNPQTNQVGQFQQHGSHQFQAQPQQHVYQVQPQFQQPPQQVYQPQPQPQYQQQPQQPQQLFQLQPQYQQPQFQQPQTQQQQQPYRPQFQQYPSTSQQQSRQNPFSMPPPEVVPMHAVPPALRQALQAQAEEERAKQQQVTQQQPTFQAVQAPFQPTFQQPMQPMFQQPLQPTFQSPMQPTFQAVQTQPTFAQQVISPITPFQSTLPMQPMQPLPPLQQTQTSVAWSPKRAQFYTPQDSAVFSQQSLSSSMQGGSTTSVPLIYEAPTTGKVTSGDTCIGIDLGTTYSCVGVYRNGQVEIMTTDSGQRTLPSVVAFLNQSSVNGNTTELERLVGDVAMSQAASNPTNTIYDAKRLIGRKFNDTSVTSDARQWPFKVVEGKDGNALVRVHEGSPLQRDLSPEEISSCILAKLKTVAEKHLNKPVTRAVITVPAYFNDAQRQATIDAAKIAGLDVLRIINEPTAAALAYGLDKTTQPESNILVFDLGGGTFDVSLLNLSHGVFKVRATGGNCHLGGIDFDQRLVSHVIERTGLSNLSAKATRRLLTACERAKRALSSATSTVVEVEAIQDGKDVRVEVSRAQFEALNRALFDSCLESVRDVLRDGGLDRSKVDQVVFVGGSTRIPRIQEMVKEYFLGKMPNMSLNPDECVAYGASIQAAILGGHHGNPGDKVLLVDVAPLSLGVETAGGLMNVLVPRNSTIPCLKTNMFSTYRDNQESVLVSIFEGERAMCADNNLLGNFYLNNIQANKAGVPKIQVTFEVDVNGVLHVSAVDEATNNQNYISIKSETGRLSAERIEELVAEAAKHRETDMKKLEQIDAKNALEKFLLELRQTLVSQEIVEKVPESQRKQISTMVTQNLEWINSVGSLATKEQLDGQKKQIQEALNPILGKLYQVSGEMPGQVDSKPTGQLESVDAKSISSGNEVSPPKNTLPPGVNVGLVTNLGPPYGNATKPNGLYIPMPPAVATNVASIGPSIIY